jgi:hypothetical protein
LTLFQRVLGRLPDLRERIIVQDLQFEDSPRSWPIRGEVHHVFFAILKVCVGQLPCASAYIRKSIFPAAEFPVRLARNRLSSSRRTRKRVGWYAPGAHPTNSCGCSRRMYRITTDMEFVILAFWRHARRGKLMQACSSYCDNGSSRAHARLSWREALRKYFDFDPMIDSFGQEMHWVVRAGGQNA